MKILITGAGGQLGSSFRKISGDYPAHTFVYADLPESDITDKAAMERLVDDNGIELIVNCAAYTAVDKAESDENTAYSINAEGPANLGLIAKKRKIGLVHISTDYVFDGEGFTPLDENAPTDPINAYGRTKLAGEQAVRATGCDALVVRTSWLYSEFGANFVKTMLRLGGERNSIGVVADQYGSPTYAPDLAKAVLTLAEEGFKGFNLYHFCNEGEASWWEFAEQIFDFAGLPVEVQAITTADYPTPAQRPAYSVLYTKKIREKGVEVADWQLSLRVCLEALGCLKN